MSILHKTKLAQRNWDMSKVIQLIRGGSGIWTEVSLAPVLFSSSSGCWETVLHVPLVFLHVLWVDAGYSLFCIIFSEIFVQWRVLEDSNDVSFQNKEYKSSLLVIKDAGSLNIEFLPYSAIHCVSKYSLALFMLPCGNWSLGNPLRMCWFSGFLLCHRSLTRSLCLLPAFMRLWLTRFLAFKWGEISDPS